ncbi:DUF3649 domain-containing protein [Pigmentiphaga litoralis]|uniref:DUF3649 domain-containing protein n=1 Tax=Pigmentiphaga litoralis TaxID=516702 RepID=A0A7Y9IS21_9BURK|nr:DUF3649 domain-containing protein [Pigmentiphaga litoralis]NYE25067.1 hypothetical protein [Pigmentiphaga litoralis]NYE81319.1 hypothetical protein [Pigmentiphaga litoralis]
MSGAASSRSPAAYRWGVFSRVMAASLGAYALASLASSVLAVALPMLSAISVADGVIIGTLMSFVFHAAAAIWVFATRSAVRAWIGIGAVSGCLALLLKGLHALA